MFEKIVVAIDGSDEAFRALDVACDLAKKYESEIHLIHSPQLESTGIAVGSGAVEIAPSSKDVAEAGKGVMNRAYQRASTHGRAPSECIVGNAEPAADILKAVETLGADLVVMGRRGLGRVSSALLGSVSQKVSHNARCTCMTVAADS